MKKSILLAVIALALAAPPAQGRDWFVRAGSEGGDGSKEKPFKDPYLALEKAESGDAIHVAAGIYHGKLESAIWKITLPNLSMLGGYDDKFTERDPWTHPSELRFVKDSKVRVEGYLIRGEQDHTNFVLDGFVIDAVEGNTYGEGELADLKRDFSPKIDLVSLSSPGCVVRNCLVLNGSDAGMTIISNGCTIENNIFMNNECQQVDVRGAAPAVEAGAKPTIVRGNTFLFGWVFPGKSYGEGGPTGNLLRIDSGVKAEVSDNVFVTADNSAIYNNTRHDRLAIKNNVFWQNGYANFATGIEGRNVAVDNSNMGDLDDLGLKACEGNEAKDPGLGKLLDPKWMEKFINRTAPQRGKVTMDDWNKARQILGLPLVAEGGKGPSGVAMPYDAKKALKLIPSVPQGAHPKKLEVKFSAGGAAASFTYDTIAYEKFLTDGQALDGKRVAIPCHLSSEKSWWPFACASEKDYRGYEFLDFTDHSGMPPIIYVKRGTNAEKLCNTLTYGAGNRSYEKYVVKGLVKYEEASTGRHKWTLLVEAIDPYTVAVVETARPKGRDWFVRAGSSGNGSLAKPWKDPWQALENCEPGDTIHVAEGEYWGKLGLGCWIVDTPYISMLGGYDKEFKERDPWKHPTRLGYKKGSKATADGTFIRGEWDHTGFILDGFVFDGSDVNAYTTDGNLDPPDSARHGLVELVSPNVTMRNCVLVNGSLGSFTSQGDGGTIENNIMINFHWQSIQLTPGKNERAFVVKNNTIVVNCDDRADGKGGSASGTGVYARGDCLMEIDNNIIGYNDRQGIFTSSEPKRMKVTNNLFTKNLFAHLSNDRELVFDDATIKTMPDAGFIDCSGNVTNVEPKLAFDKAWMAVYVGRTMTVHGKVPDDDWNKLRDILGLPQRAEGGTFATGYCQVYPWKKALEFFPQNPDVKQGARRVKLEAKYDPNPPPLPAPKSYQTVEWTTFCEQIDSIDKKDVEVVGMLGGVMGESDSYFGVEGVKSSGYLVIELMGPQGKDTPGLPCRAYVKRGSRAEKVVKKTDDKAQYKLRGTARKSEAFARGCLVIDSIEKVE